MKIPTSPESDGEIYLTPNTSVGPSMDDDKTNDSGIDDGTTTTKSTTIPTIQLPSMYKVTKIQSLTNISSIKQYISLECNDSNDYDDQVDSGLDEKQQQQQTQNGCFSTPVYRMKSLGNLSQYERSFGDTPKDLMKLKAEFEKRRFGLARRRSLTNLLTENDNIRLDDATNRETIQPKPRESIFNVKSVVNNSTGGSNSMNGSGGGKYRKKIGVGDTKYIGNVDGEQSTDGKQYHLTKIKSLGTIPDLLTERIGFEPFLTPSANRRYPASLHDYRAENGADPPPMGDSSSDGDDECVLRAKPRTSDRLRYIDEISLFRGPFERGFRRSYNKDTGHTNNNATGASASTFRQSDGYMPTNFPVLRSKQRHKSGGDLKIRTSLHSLSSLSTSSSQQAPLSSQNGGRADVIRYGHTINITFDTYEHRQ